MTLMPNSVFTVGYDTLAEGFGYNLYCRALNTVVECPLCACWRVWEECLCGATVTLHKRGRKWASVLTSDLLGVDATGFYLPRAWNPSGKWVTKAKLADMYATFLQEVSYV